MRYRKTTLLGAAAIVAASVSLVPRIGFSLFPKAGIPQVLINIETPVGTSLSKTDEVVARIEQSLAEKREVRHFVASIGEGHPQVYYNRSPQSQASNVADVLVELAHYSADETPVFLEQLRTEYASIPGAKIVIREFENGPPVAAPIEIRVMGNDLAALKTTAAAVSAELAAISGVRTVDNPLANERTDLKVKVDEGRAALVGVVPSEVDRTVRAAIRGLPIGKVAREGDDDIDLVVGSTQRSAKELPDLSGLRYVTIASRFGGSVPFAAVATIHMDTSFASIYHYNRERYVSITADVAEGENTSAVWSKVLAKMEATRMQPGQRWMAGGLVESQQESFAGLGPAILIAVFGILAVLVLEFGSFRSTLIVAAVIPLGVAGGLFGLFIAGETLSFTASIGFIALTGIEVKNSLLLVDFTEQLRSEGVPIQEAIRRAGEIRFFPILLTSLTAIGGLTPLILENSALYSPLAIVLVGGLVTSTVLSRLITPVLSSLLLRDEKKTIEPRVGALADAQL